MSSEEFLTDGEIAKVTDALSSRSVDRLAHSVLSIEKVLKAIRQSIVNHGDSKDGKEMLAVISVEQDPMTVLQKEQGEKQIDLTDMITKDGKLKKKKAKKQLSPEEIKEKLRKLRESRDDIPMKTCEVCGYRTREPYKMRRHERTHTGEKPFKCPLCPFRGAEKSVVVKHLKSNVHSKKSTIASMKAGSAGGMGLRIDCDQCSFTASSSQQMLKHKQHRHEGSVKRVGKLSCPFCDYRNSYQKVMDLHIKAHEEEGTAVPNKSKTSDVEPVNNTDEDGVVTVFLEDFMPGNQTSAAGSSHSQLTQPIGNEGMHTNQDTQASANDDGVDELLTSING